MRRRRVPTRQKVMENTRSRASSRCEGMCLLQRRCEAVDTMVTTVPEPRVTRVTIIMSSLTKFSFPCSMPPNLKIKRLATLRT